MTELRKGNDRIAVGLGHPGKQDLAEIAKDGFRAVVNLRHHDEEGQPLQPDQEGEQVRSLGMDYVHIPISCESLNRSVVDRFRDSVADLPGRVMVHCASGKRSGGLCDDACRVEGEHVRRRSTAKSGGVGRRVGQRRPRGISEKLYR